MDNSPKSQTRPSSSADTPSVEMEDVVRKSTAETALPTDSNKNDSHDNNNGDNIVVNVSADSNDSGSAVASAESCVSGRQMSQTRPSSEEYIDLSKCGKLSVEMGFSLPQQTRFRIFKDGSMFASFYGDDGLPKTTRVTKENSSEFPEWQIKEVLNSSKRKGISIAF